MWFYKKKKKKQIERLRFKSDELMKNVLNKISMKNKIR